MAQNKKSKKFENANELYLTKNYIAKKVEKTDKETKVFVDKTIYYPKTKENLAQAKATGKLKEKRPRKKAVKKTKKNN